MHRTLDQLQAAFDAMPEPTGTVTLLVRRLPDEGRETPDRARLSAADGFEGDRWNPETSHPEAAVTLMDHRVAQALLGGRDVELAGDNLIVDMDLGEDALPIGTRLKVGSAVLRITPEPHTGCKKFARRYGTEALKWVNSKAVRHLRRRGVHAVVEVDGEVAVGDRIERV